MSAVELGAEQEDFASEAVATVTAPPLLGPEAPAAPVSAPPTAPRGTCVNCGSDVTLQQVATDTARHTYQWVPAGEARRPGRWCSEAAMPAYHWAHGATAAVYHVSI
ncbi:hypothetical protein [Promicromonospora sp. NPDC060271]|uniref:hypothetical protein n=1 Tax=Promicromonospora sp. NPDC060271 TaxID=3347089 RepID=UPI00365988D7